MTKDYNERLRSFAGRAKDKKVRDDAEYVVVAALGGPTEYGAKSTAHAVINALYLAGFVLKRVTK